MMRQNRDFKHEWSLPLSLRADANGWCSCHNNSSKSNSLFLQYINPWERSANALSMHSVKLDLHLVFLLEISPVGWSLLCHKDMVVLSPVMWKTLITNTSALLMRQNKFHWTVVGNVLYMNGTQISIVHIVTQSPLPPVEELSILFQSILLSLHMIFF